MRVLKMSSFIIVLLLTQNISAQHRKGDSRNNKRHTQITELIDLTDSQIAELDKINENFRTEIKNISENITDKKISIAAIKSAMEKKKEKTEALFTEKQLNELAEIRKEHKAEKIFDKMNRKAKSEELRAELKVYYDNEMLPELREWRQEFNHKISKEDQAILEELKMKRQRNHNDNEEIKRAQRHERGKMRDNDKMKLIIQKYTVELADLKKEKAFTLEKWNLERQLIRVKFKKNNDGMKKNAERKGRQNKEHKGGELLNAPRFLLMEY